VSTTIKYPRGAAGISLRTTIIYLRGAAIIGLGTTAKCLRSSTSAAVIGLGTTIKYLAIENAGAGNNWTKAHDKKVVYEFSGNPCSVADFVVNSRGTPLASCVCGA
jgi:hypothetical protein